MLKFNLISNKPVNPVLSMMGRPACPCSMPTRFPIGTAVAFMVMPDVGFIIIIMALTGRL